MGTLDGRDVQAKAWHGLQAGFANWEDERELDLVLMMKFMSAFGSFF